MSKREFLKITGTISKTKNVTDSMENDTKEIPQDTKGQRRNNEREAELSAQKESKPYGPMQPKLEN